MAKDNGEFFNIEKRVWAIRAIMVRKNITIKQIAAGIGVHRTAVSAALNIYSQSKILDAMEKALDNSLVKTPQTVL